MDEEHAAGLWIRYTTDAFLNAPGALIVPFEDLYDCPDRVAHEFARLFSVGPCIDEVAPRAEEAVETGLRHHHDTPAPKGPRMEAAFELHGKLTGPLPESAAAECLALRARWPA